MKKRLFIAMPLGEEWLGAFGDFQKRCDREMRELRDFRWTKVDNLHITICFLGWIEEEKVPEISQKLKEILTGVKSFELEFDTIAFAPPHRTPYMIWAVFKNSQAYQELVKSVNEAIHPHTYNEIGVGVKEFSEEVASEEGRESIPHITLARFKDGRVSKHEDMLKLFSTKEIILKVDNILLMESKLSPTGPTYFSIENFALAQR